MNAKPLKAIPASYILIHVLSHVIKHYAMKAYMRVKIQLQYF
jgi:hypothetical protein